jgi:cytochrome c553
MIHQWRWAAAAGAGGLALTIAACGAGGNANGFPDWAFPGPGTETAPTPAQAAEFVTLPGVARRFPRSQLSNFRGPVADWRPDSHPPAPPVVLLPQPGGVAACGYCHLPGGEGRPENASLAGLPADYIKAQILAFRAGDRTGAKPDWIPTALMIQEAKALSDKDLAAAAAYFAKAPFRSRFTVVEAAEVGRPTEDGFVLHATDGPKAPLGHRIVETPASVETFEKRDPDVTFTAYVPVGSLARGKTLVDTGGPLKQPCSACHGAGLRGGEGLPGPPLAGRGPSYLFRQLYAFQTGGRKGGMADVMRQETAGMSRDDLIALAAYVASMRAN